MSERDTLVAEIKRLGGVVRPDWTNDGYRAQIESLHEDVRARHENLEDVAALYPDATDHALVSLLAAEHQAQVDDLARLAKRQLSPARLGDHFDSRSALRAELRQLRAEKSDPAREG